MKREYPSLGQLQAEHRATKEIPEEYAEVILKTLHFFPELRNTDIRFKVVEDVKKTKGPEPPIVSSTIPPIKRQYTVNILDSTSPTFEQALFRNLPFEAQMASIAQELAVIAHFDEARNLKALKLFRRGKTDERELGRKADISVIEHGLGFELYLFATYLRSIPGYLDARKDIEINMLNPNEILEALPPEQLHEVHRF